MPDFSQILGFVKDLKEVIATLFILVPATLAYFNELRHRASALVKKAKEKREEGITALLPWVIRQVHETAAGYKFINGKSMSSSEKISLVKDTLLAGVRRHLDEDDSMSNEELEQWFQKARALWKDSKLRLKGELDHKISDTFEPEIEAVPGELMEFLPEADAEGNPSSEPPASS